MFLGGHGLFGAHSMGECLWPIRVARPMDDLTWMYVPCIVCAPVALASGTYEASCCGLPVCQAVAGRRGFQSIFPAGLAPR